MHPFFQNTETGSKRRLRYHHDQVVKADDEVIVVAEENGPIVESQENDASQSVEETPEKDVAQPLSVEVAEDDESMIVNEIPAGIEQRVCFNLKKNLL